MARSPSLVGTIGQQPGTCQVMVDVVTAAASSYNNTLPAVIGNTRGLTSAAFSRSLTVSAPVSITKTFNPYDCSSRGCRHDDHHHQEQRCDWGSDQYGVQRQLPANLELLSVGARCNGGVNGTATANTGVCRTGLSTWAELWLQAVVPCTVTAQVRALAEADIPIRCPPMV